MKRKNFGAALVGGALAAMLALVAPQAAWAQSNDSDQPSSAADPALTQVVESDETVAPSGEAAELSVGHADMGPKLSEDGLELLVRDDSQAEPVWRHLSDVVFRVSDAGQLEVPGGDEFAFTGAAGKTVWVVPQQEISGVLWLGWNTQDPALISQTEGGVSLIFGGHQGDGDFSAFLQAGNFSGPQVLWDSHVGNSQPIHVDLNTHAHANWVFTEPGVHLVKITAEAKLTSGETVSDTQVLRFAVGDSADANEARAAQWQMENEPEKPAQMEAPSEFDNSNRAPLAMAAIAGGIALLIVAGAGFFAMRARRAKAQAAELAAQNSGAGAGQGTGAESPSAPATGGEQ